MVRGVVKKVVEQGMLLCRMDDPIREIEEGLVQGFSYHFSEVDFIGIDKYLDIFYGIPFAEPPIGDLRWQLPVPKANWDGILNATSRSAACFQENPATIYLRKSEDCLYLNVYAPSPKPNGAAVMVFFHGGGFSFGSGMQFEYDGAPITAVGDIIYVAVNYRLNVFGSLSTGDEASPGNYGMFDQLESLKWVQRNIEVFGGDPNRVTIFGESAGAASAGFHLLSKESHSFFNQVILESGAASCDWAFTDVEVARERAIAMGQECGCDTSNTMTMVECLRTKDVQDIFDASVVAGVYGSATVDGVFLDDLPMNYINRGDFKNVNIMVGTNQDEGALNAIGVYPDYLFADDPPHMNRSDFLREVPRYVGEDNPVFLDAMYQEYTPWDVVDKPDADYLRAFIDINTDLKFACPTDIVARVHAEAGDNVYMYQMTRDPSASLLSIGPIGPGWTGAAHSEELQFVFGSPFMETNLHGKLNDDDKALTVEFMKYWTNFAKTGDPNDAGLATWPLFTVPEMEYLMLDLNSTTGRALKAKPCAFWNDYMVKLRSFADNLPEMEKQWREEFYAWKNVHMPEWKEQFDDYKEVTGHCDKEGGCK
ncbi:acetylcholinesterase-like [Amphiura filiformis]|uniref:acetylcholinesterase-like n=1 Tax=Amphiura filiformis TaxID=82378 RepID=UPI003B21ED66